MKIKLKKLSFGWLRLSAGMVAIVAACGTAHASDEALDPAVLEVLRAPIEGQDNLGAQTQGESRIKDRPGRDYLLPALEIMAFDGLLNRFDHYFIGDDYDVSLKSVRRNLRSSWVLDSDPFEINQLGHPYQGSIYFNFARSAGFNFWESFAYTFAGSAFWEIAGETTPPSRNDQITTSFGGSFLGESLYRMANLVLEKDRSMSPFWRELTAAAISPAAGFNRYAFDDRFDQIFNSSNPAYYRQLQLGARHTARKKIGTSREVEDAEAIMDFSLDYGLPGKPGYDYSRPFDYFNFQMAASSSTVIESLTNRGMILGKRLEAGRAYRGIVGLYGSYDYLSPQLFRVANTALSLGTTGQWWLSKNIAVQGTGMAGIGYASVGTLRGAAERDYSYGIAPQALLALRLIFGDKAALDLTARKYFVRDATISAGGGRDNILRADASLTMRMHKRHALSLKYVFSRRDAVSPSLGERKQSRSTIGIFYTLLGEAGFGAVDWR